MGLGETESLIHKKILSGKSCELESFWFDNVQMWAGIRHLLSYECTIRPRAISQWDLLAGEVWEGDEWLISGNGWLSRDMGDKAGRWVPNQVHGG